AGVTAPVGRNVRRRREHCTGAPGEPAPCVGAPRHRRVDIRGGPAPPGAERSEPAGVVAQGPEPPACCAGGRDGRGAMRVRWWRTEVVCQQWVELVTAYLEGALPRRTTKAIDRHLAG